MRITVHAVRIGSGNPKTTEYSMYSVVLRVSSGGLVATAYYRICITCVTHAPVSWQEIHCDYKACQGVFAHCKPVHADVVLLEESQSGIICIKERIIGVNNRLISFIYHLFTTTSFWLDIHNNLWNMSPQEYSTNCTSNLGQRLFSSKMV